MARILVVEDDSDLQYLYDMMLARRGYEVIAAETSTEALLHLTNSLFDLIILDMNMPDAPGIRVLQFARSDSRLCQIPVLVISANEHYQRIASELGVSEYFTKPMPMQQLTLTVEQMLHRNGNGKGDQNA